MSPALAQTTTQTTGIGVTPTVTTPGVPTTGMGGFVVSNVLLLVLAIGLVCSGLTINRRQRA